MPSVDREMNGDSNDVELSININALSENELEVTGWAISQEYDDDEPDKWGWNADILEKTRNKRTLVWGMLIDTSWKLKPDGKYNWK